AAESRSVSLQGLHIGGVFQTASRPLVLEEGLPPQHKNAQSVEVSFLAAQPSLIKAHARDTRNEIDTVGRLSQLDDLPLCGEVRELDAQLSKPEIIQRSQHLACILARGANQKVGIS